MLVFLRRGKSLISLKAGRGYNFGIGVIFFIYCLKAASYLSKVVVVALSSFLIYSAPSLYEKVCSILSSAGLLIKFYNSFISHIILFFVNLDDAEETLETRQIFVRSLKKTQNNANS